MSHPNAAKHEEMRKNGTFNHRADKVSSELFAGSAFFDAHDAVQVKYEMLRAASEGQGDVTSIAAAFGFSRVSFYQIKKEFDENGIAGLTPKKRGPKGSRKLNGDDLEFARSLVGTCTKAQIVTRLWEERGVIISKRTLERQLPDKKNG